MRNGVVVFVISSWVRYEGDRWRRRKSYHCWSDIEIQRNDMDQPFGRGSCGILRVAIHSLNYDILNVLHFGFLARCKSHWKSQKRDWLLKGGTIGWQPIGSWRECWSDLGDSRCMVWMMCGFRFEGGSKLPYRLSSINFSATMGSSIVSQTPWRDESYWSSNGV
jgi:hypothetical protein